MSDRDSKDSVDRWDDPADAQRVLRCVEEARRQSAMLPAPRREEAERMVAATTQRFGPKAPSLSTWGRLLIAIGLATAK